MVRHQPPTQQQTRIGSICREQIHECRRQADAVVARREKQRQVTIDEGEQLPLMLGRGIIQHDTGDPSVMRPRCRRSQARQMQNKHRPSLHFSTQGAFNGVPQGKRRFLCCLKLCRSFGCRQYQGRRLRFLPVDYRSMVTKKLADSLPAAAPPDRIYAIGDVHGQRKQLDAVHALIRKDLLEHPVARAHIIHLGDYIDRGPASAECLQLLVQGSPVPGVPCTNLLGNHEQMLLNTLANPRDGDLWLSNGGQA
ncbi:MAG: hypothetical protein EON55_06260, partial [Alphaproteobacteria bacterium]